MRVIKNMLLRRLFSYHVYYKHVATPKALTMPSVTALTPPHNTAIHHVATKEASLLRRSIGHH
jgi:hypothetical protein